MAGKVSSADQQGERSSDDGSDRALVVTRVPFNGVLLSEILGALGYRVAVAATATEVLCTRRDMPIDLVVLDEQGMSDDETNTFRAVIDGNTATRFGISPVLACTARHVSVSERDDREIRGWITKPFRVDQIKAVLDGLRHRAAAGDGNVDEAATARFDEALADARSFMTPTVLARALAVFARDVRDLAALGAAYDPVESSRKAHALISSACIFGFVSLSSACQALEASVFAGTDVDERLQALRAELDLASRILLRHRYRDASTPRNLAPIPRD